MHRFKRVMVGLNLSEQDETTIDYAAMISRMAKSEKIFFVHFVPRLKIPMSLRLRYPNLYRPVLNDLERTIAKHWKGSQDVELAYDVFEGTPSTEMSYRAAINAIDLILVGNRRQHRKSGALPEELVLHAPCPVLIVPQGTAPQLARTVALEFGANVSAESITRFVQARRADLLIVETQGRNAKTDAQFQHVVNRLLQSLNSPLLFVKETGVEPPAFEIPRERRYKAHEECSA